MLMYFLTNSFTKDKEQIGSEFIDASIVLGCCHPCKAFRGTTARKAGRGDEAGGSERTGGLGRSIGRR